MNNNNNNKHAVGLDVGTILTIVFVVLKLCGVINWAWIWVLSPLWISAAITIVLIILLIVIAKIKERQFWD